ncbi:MAG: TetR/AcrR family transcriptional regulator [Lachnospiraceae bacterium]|nr:TetR/AcrR family transcriptional regulator [Lachnospiraceae bacterium]
MGRAFSEEEKESLKIKLMETAVELYHEKGKKSLSIRELTKRAGISLGSFYNFWEDKDALVLDVMKYRIAQKLDMIAKSFPDSLDDPAGYLTDKLYEWCMDFKEKIDTKPIYRESISTLRRSSADEENRIASLYKGFLNKLADYWTENKAVTEVDMQGVINVFTAVGVMLSEKEQFDPQYYSGLFRTMIEAGVRKYIKTKKHKTAKR